MTSPDAFTLTRLFIKPGTQAAPTGLTQPWIGGILTAWDATSGANTVMVGPTQYTNLLAVNPAALSAGPVLLAKGSAGYIIMGNSIKAPSGTVPGTGPTSYNIQYPCTGSRSYDSSDNFIGSPDGDNNIYQGSLSGRGFGNEHSMWCFDGALIRSNLAGAVVTSAKIWMYCFACNSDTGGCDYGWLTNTTVAATWPGAGVGGHSTSNNWPVPGWGSIDILGTEHTRILNDNMNSLSIKGPIFSDPTGFRGYGFSVSLRPYLQFAFTV